MSLLQGTAFLLGVILLENPVTRQEFIAETDKIFSKLNRHDREISVLQTVVENFKELPSAINKLDKTMALMSQNLELLNQKVDNIVSRQENKDGHDIEKDKEQDEKLRELDEKSKVDILVFLKDNWWKITMAVAAVAVFLKDYIQV